MDMLGPWADVIPTSSLQNLCLVVEPDLALSIHAQNQAIHNASLTVSDMLAASTTEPW